MLGLRRLFTKTRVNTLSELQVRKQMGIVKANVNCYQKGSGKNKQGEKEKY